APPRPDPRATPPSASAPRAVGGAGLDLQAEVLGVELLGLVLVVDEDAGQPDAHRPPPFLRSLGQLAILTVLRCYPPGTVAGGSAYPSESPGSCQRLDRGQSRPAALAGVARHNGSGGAACWAAPGGMPAP